MISKKDFGAPEKEMWSLINLNCAFDDVYDFVAEECRGVQEKIKQGNVDENLDDLILGSSLLFSKLVEGVSDLRYKYHYDDKERAERTAGMLDSDPCKESVLNFLIDYDAYIPELDRFYRPKFESLANDLISGRNDYDINLLQKISGSGAYSGLLKKCGLGEDGMKNVMNKKAKCLLSRIDKLSVEFNDKNYRY